jgi:hypothetical protein
MLDEMDGAFTACKNGALLFLNYGTSRRGRFIRSLILFLSYGTHKVFPPFSEGTVYPFPNPFSQITEHIKCSLLRGGDGLSVP